jgi:hypothetical protein
MNPRSLILVLSECIPMLIEYKIQNAVDQIRSLRAGAN